MRDDKNAISWEEGAGRAFPEPKKELDLYHGKQDVGDDSLTETWYYGFNVPEESLYCFVYIWAHTNLEVISSGVLLFGGGNNTSPLQAEFIDFRSYESMPDIGDGRSFNLPVGLDVEIVDPLDQIRVSFASQCGDCRFDFDMKAVMPAAVRANNKHFEQCMRVSGALDLRGRHIPIDCLFVRDRSWGQARSERPLALPPTQYITGAFDDGFAFTVVAMDDPEKRPIWQGTYNISREKAMTDGWLWSGNRLLRFSDISVETEYEPRLLYPLLYRISAVDTEGGRHQFTAETTSSGLFKPWMNINSYCQLLKLTDDRGSIGWGNANSAGWHDFHRRSSRTTP